MRFEARLKNLESHYLYEFSGLFTVIDPKKMLWKTA
jgi:hypothetical protein